MTAKTPSTTGPKIITPTGGADELPLYDPSQSWDAAVADADKIAGHELVKDEILDALKGVPFLITRITTRPGTPKNGKPADYFSCECVIASEKDLRRRRVDLSMLPFSPEDQIVFNDSSTGIHRQIVFYLQAKGYIVLPEGATEGVSGESIFDLPASDWLEIKRGKARFLEDGYMEYSANIRLYCPRGIRISEYDNEFSKDAKTRYLA